MIGTLFEITISMSAVILLLFMLMPFMKKRYSAKLRYYIWLVIALRLCLPFNITLPKAPVKLNMENTSIIPKNIRGENGGKIISETNVTQPHQNENAESSESAKSTDCTKKEIPLKNIITYIWLLGAAGFFAFYMYGYFSFKRKIRAHLYECDNTLLTETAQPLGIKRIPKLYKCPLIDSPMVTGFFTHAVIIPEKEYTADEMSGILKHELIHLKRGDIWYKLILIIAKSIHFFNPIVHIMVKTACRDIEYSCDDAVVENRDIEFRKKYSLAILKSMTRADMGFSVNLGESEKQKKQRFKNILNTKAKKKGTAVFITAFLAVLTAGAFISLNNVEKAENVKKTFSFDYNTVAEQLKNRDENDDDLIVINTGGELRRGKELLDNFLKSINGGKPAEFTSLMYTVEGDAIYTYVLFDGDKFYSVEDDSRDKFRGDGEAYVSYESKYLKEFDGGDYLTYIMLDDDSLTYDDIVKSWLSSTTEAFVKMKVLFSIEK